MALIINGERVEDSAIAQVRDQLAAQAAGCEGEPEWEEKGKDLDTFAKDMVIAQVLTLQEAKRRGEAIPGKEVQRAFDRVKEAYDGEEEFRQHLNEANHTDGEGRSPEKASRPMEQIKQDIELSLKVDRLLDVACKDLTEPSQEEVRDCYEAHTSAFRTPERIRVAHIVKHVQGTILDFQAARSDLSGVLDELNQGADFQALAARCSDCPENGGDLGYFARGAMVLEFENVVFALKKGEVSGIFQTPYGLHIARLYDRIPAKERPFSEVKDEVKEVLQRERENAAIDAFTDQLKRHATIEEAG